MKIKNFCGGFLSLFAAVTLVSSTSAFAASESNSNKTVIANPDAPIELENVSEQPLFSDEALGKIDEALQRIDLRAKAQVGFLESENFGMSAWWMRKVEASFRQGDTTLIDEFGLKFVLGENFYNGNNDSDNHNEKFFGIGLDGQAKFYFARQFGGDRLKDHLGIFLKMPYTPFKNFPFNSQKALKNLVKDDFVAFSANLNLIVSASQLTNMGAHFYGGVSAYYMLSGEFQFHIIRLADDKIRVKIIGVKSKTLGIKAFIGLDPKNDLEITQVNFVDEKLRGRLRITPLEIGISWPRGSVFMVDYIADLKSEEVRSAYDKLVKSIFTLKSVKRVNPLERTKNVEAMVLADASELEDIYNREKDKNVGDRAVDRMFKGNNQIIGGNTFNFRIGQGDIAEAKVTQNYSENVITAVDHDNVKRNFYLPDFNSIMSAKALLSYFSEEVYRRTNVLFEVNESKELLGLGEMSFYTEYRDKKFTKKEIAGLQTLIKNQLPYGIYSQIDWRDWNDGKDRVNARVTSRLVLRPEALDYANEISGIEIYNRLVAFLQAYGPINVVSEQPEKETGNLFNADVTVKYKYDLEKITGVLARTFRTSYTPQERGAEFVQLRSNPLWSEIGPAFLVRLLENKAKENKGDEGEQDLISKMWYETTWEATNTDTVHYIYGNCQNRSLYKAVMYLYSAMTNREIDLRLIDDNDQPDVPKSANSAACRE